MSGTQTTATQEFHTLADQPLDVLIPRPLGPGLRLVVSIVLIAIAIGVSIANNQGLLYPRPFAGGSFNTGGAMIYDADREAVGAFVSIPNYSARDVRLIDVTFDAPGAELVGVTYVDDFDRTLTGGPLPVTIPENESAGLDGGIWVFFRPTTCEDPVGDADGRWGHVHATFDFGDGAFPPITTTHVVDDEVWATYEQRASVQLPGIEFIEGDGPLSLACEVLR